MATRKKEFDCIQTKREAQHEIYQAIKQMTPEQEINYFRKSVGESKFSKWWESISPHVESSQAQ